MKSKKIIKIYIVPEDSQKQSEYIIMPLTETNRDLILKWLEIYEIKEIEDE